MCNSELNTGYLTQFPTLIPLALGCSPAEPSFNILSQT